MVDNDEILKIKETEDISSKNLQYLEKIMQLAVDNNIQLILVKSPCQLTEKEQKNYNWLEEYAKDKDIMFINYNEKIEELDLEYGDFYDNGHLSGTGAKKVSEDFSKYLL
jgi:CO dehydrogenase nickel-insertion accessory protein CooC1